MSDPYTSRVEAVAALLDIAELAVNYIGMVHGGPGTEQTVKAHAALFTLGVGQYDIEAADALRARRAAG